MGAALKPFVVAALLNLVIGKARAQEASPSGTTTSSAAAATFTVDVGRADHVFRPDVIQASVGDIVQFNFFPPNHSVVRAEWVTCIHPICLACLTLRQIWIPMYSI